MLKVFISYSHKDRDLLDELSAQLATLRNMQLIETWTDKQIQAGTEWEPDIWNHFNSADILILLISAPFLDSYYCYRKEFEAAEQRHLKKEARILPVIVRSCDWKDGRLDRLQCLCADRAVALYGDQPTDRDPAWTLVVTEIRKVVTALASRAKPASTGALAKDEEDDEGDLVHLLCNRQIQEQGIFEKFFSAAPGSPQVYFLPGAEDASHASFLTRVQCSIVPRLLGEEFESLRHLTQFIGAEWVQKPPSGKELPYLTAKLAWQIDAKLRPDASLIRKHPKVAGNIVVIQHRLYIKYWNDKTIGLLRDYIAFWKKAAGEDDRPLFLIFFSVIFAEGCHPEAPELKALSALAAELDGESCSVATLDPLGPVEWEHVDAWLSTYLPRRRDHADTLRQDLFPTPTPKPMRDVEPALRDFVEQA